MQKVALVGGCRTPFVKAGGAFASQSLLDLGAHTLKSLVERMALDPAAIEEVIFGTVLLDPRAPNFAREIVFKAGLPRSVGAHSVSNNCISGLVCVAFLADAIRTGRVKIGIAGGTESMSRPTLTFHPKTEKLFLELFRAKSAVQRIKILSKFRPKMFLPQAPSPKEPSTGLTMGQHCEITTKSLAISREWQDHIACRSHANAAKAQAEGRLAEEIAPLAGVDRDNIIRADTSMEKLGALKPVFDRSKSGTITAGNASPLTDGASAVCLMSEDEARAQRREILALVEAVEFSAIDANDGLLMAPAFALPKVLRRMNLTVADIGLFEIHEAFGAQVAANLKVWAEGWPRFPELEPIGLIPEEKINVNGGSIAVGHPFAATGGRLVLSAALELRRRRQRYAALSVCAAGAMAGAVILSNPNA